MKYVFFLNMGGVNSLDECELFLKNMFKDPAILRVNPVFRAFLSLMIRKSRLKQMRANYEAIGGKSPLSSISKSLCDKLNSQFKNIHFDFISLYVPPFAKDVFEKYHFKKEDELVLFPLYPQFSTTTTAPSFKDALKQLAKKQGSYIQGMQFKSLKGEADFIFHEWGDFNFEKELLLCASKLGFKSLELKASFYNDKAYNAMLCEHIIEANASFLPLQKKTLLLSAHSLPVSVIKAGDPYEEQIKTQVALLKEGLKGVFDEIILCYQSKLGPIKWLGPSTEETLKSLKNEALIYPLSFCIDCSESVFELDIEYRPIAAKEYFVIPCPNDSLGFMSYIIKHLYE